MAFPIHQTPADACDVHPTGWVRVALPGGGVVEVTRLPLIDTRQLGPVFARPNYATSLVVAAAMRATLMSTGLVDLICQEGFYIDPVIVRETPAESAERRKRGGQNPLERMATVEWATRHDNAVLGQLTAPGRIWSGYPPVCNGGKDWILGARPGMALNYGWDTDERPEVTRMIQTLGTKHDKFHTDYSQTLRLVRAANDVDTLDDVLGWVWSVSPNLRTVAANLGVLWDELTDPTQENAA